MNEEKKMNEKKEEKWISTDNLKKWIKENIPLNKSDLPSISQTFLFGGTAYALYNMYLLILNRKTDPSKKLKFHTDMIHRDTYMLEAFVILQCYSDLNKRSFEKLISFIDCLLFLEYQLLTKTVNPKKNDKPIAISYYNLIKFHLEILLHRGKKYLTAEHVYNVNEQIQLIYKQCRIHLCNIIQIVDDSRPEQYIREMQEILKNQDDIDDKYYQKQFDNYNFTNEKKSMRLKKKSVKKSVNQ